MTNIIHIIHSCIFALPVLCALGLYWFYSRKSNKELEVAERNLDPDFDSHRKEWDYINNNYAVFI